MKQKRGGNENDAGNIRNETKTMGATSGMK